MSASPPSGLLKAGTILLLVGAIPCMVSPEGEAQARARSQAP